VLYQDTLQQESSPKFSYQTHVTDISIGRTRTRVLAKVRRSPGSHLHRNSASHLRKTYSQPPGTIPPGHDDVGIISQILLDFTEADSCFICSRRKDRRESSFSCFICSRRKDRRKDRWNGFWLCLSFVQSTEIDRQKGITHEGEIDRCGRR